MIYLYTANVNQFYDMYEHHRDIFEERMSLLCPERRKKVNEVRQPKDKARALGAGLLLQSALQDYLSLSFGNRDCGHREEKGMKHIITFETEDLQKAIHQRHLEIAYGEKGKPYLPEFPGLIFPCLIPETMLRLHYPVIRSEWIFRKKGTVSEALQKKYYTKEERESGAKPFDIFSGKESYIKFTGKA